MKKKKALGQFFTTNSDYILKGLESTVAGKDVYDPFAGGGDLLTWAKKHGAKKIYGSDIDKSLVKGNITWNDSLVSIPTAKFIITNPPYLASNKMSAAKKKKYPMNEYEDFYLLSIKKISEADPDEGIIIVPVNFFSAENSDKLRIEFLEKYNITKVNSFTTQVFEDTTYNVVAFHFSRKTKKSDKQTLSFTFYPDGSSKSFIVEKEYDYRIAGRELFEITKLSTMKATRLTEDMMTKNAGSGKVKAFFNDLKTKKEYRVRPSFRGQIKKNIILLNCIDTNGSEDGWIKAEDVRKYDLDCLVGKNSSRNIAYVLLSGISLQAQELIIPMFNDKLNALRKEYNSLFLTNFRDNNRKRVSFEFCYKLIAYCAVQVTLRLHQTRQAEVSE